MHAKFRPILGVAIDKVREIQFPVWATPKFDGIRCLTTDLMPNNDSHACVPVCRSMKAVPNNHIYETIAQSCPPGLDGEIMTYEYPKLTPRSFQRVQSDVMSEDGHPLFTYHVFDMFEPNGELWWIHQYAYHYRLAQLAKYFRTNGVPRFVNLVDVTVCNNLGELEKFEERCLVEGHEGVCFRTPNSPYKYGRSTPKEQYLVKMKRFSTDEALVIGSVEEMHNSNPASRNELGYQERSSHKRGMVGKGRLGALICRTKWGVEFQIGSGFTQTQRENMWEFRDTLPGKIAQYKHQPHGQKDRPRIPIFLGFRDARDLEQPSAPGQGQLL